MALSFAVLLAAALSAFAPPAQACSQWGPPLLTRPGFARAPGNLLFFELNDRPMPGDLSLIDAFTEAVIPTHDFFVGEDHVFAPVEPIEPGRRLALLDASDPTEGTVRYEFSTTEHVEVALQPIVLREVEHDGRNVTFEYTIPEDYAKVRHLLSITQTVNGGRYWSPRPAGSNQFVVTTNCNGTVTEDSCGKTLDVPAGENEAGVTVHLFGLAQQPEPARLRFETTCRRPHAFGLASCAISDRAGGGIGALLVAFGMLLVRRRST